jgi:hypothetical protein
MTQPTETFDAYDAKGVREDLQDKIYMVSPEATPVLSAGRRFKATQKAHEWQTDTLATPNKDNAVIEGDDRTGTAIVSTTRIGNYTQLFDKVAIVTSTLEKSNTAGRSSEMKYQIAKRFKELKRDLEAALISKNVAVAGNGTTARKASGLGAMITTNALHNGAGATPAATSGFYTAALTAGTNRTFAEPLVKTLMQSIYTNSGEMPTMMSMTPAHKATFSGFTGIASTRFNTSNKKTQAVIIGGADVYVSDFGELTIVPNYIQATAATDVVYVLNPESYGVAYLQDFQSTPLAKTGHTMKELVFCEATVVVTAEASIGKIDNLTP